MKKIFTIGALFFSILAQGQRAGKAPEGDAWLVMPSIGLQFAGGDMAARFGQSYSAGLGVGYKTNNNWNYSVQAQFMFGTDVKDGAQLLNTALSPNGFIFNQTGNYATFALDQRGLYGSFDVSKTIPDFLAANSNSGVNILIGAGYLAHWININNVGDDSPQIIDDYAKGYDELTGGFMIKQSIGYQYLSADRRVNFRFSFEIMEAFTTNQRGFSYSTGRETGDQRLDLVYGFRLAWILPIYSQPSNTYYYN